MRWEYDFFKGKWGVIILFKGKICIMIYFDDDVLDYFWIEVEVRGMGY